METELIHLFYYYLFINLFILVPKLFIKSPLMEQKVIIIMTMKSSQDHTKIVILMRKRISQNYNMKIHYDPTLVIIT